MIVKRIHDYHMCLDEHAPGIQSWLRRWQPGTPDREPEFEHLIRQEVTPGTTVVELGANVGYLTFMMWRLLKGEGQVFGLEPDPRNFSLLTRGIALNEAQSQVEVWNLAVSNTDGMAPFYLGTATNLSGMRRTKNTPGHMINVRTQTLTSFMQSKPLPHFIKMDIEGHEVEALEGALELFAQQFPCKILMEVHPQLLDPTRFATVCRQLLGLGFHYKFVVSAGMPQPDLFKQKGYRPKQIFHGHWPRGLYDDITDDDALWLSCYPHQQDCGKAISPKICRSVLLERV
jgi:FkbM family methyltransferase